MLKVSSEKPVILVGGSGFYLQAFEKGMLPAPKTSPEVQQHWEERLEAEGPEALHRELSDRDPEYAKRVAPQDQYRLLSALECDGSRGQRQ